VIASAPYSVRCMPGSFDLTPTSCFQVASILTEPISQLTGSFGQRLRHAMAAVTHADVGGTTFHAAGQTTAALAIHDQFAHQAWWASEFAGHSSSSSLHNNPGDVPTRGPLVARPVLPVLEATLTLPQQRFGLAPYQSAPESEPAGDALRRFTEASSPRYFARTLPLPFNDFSLSGPLV